MYTVKIKKKKEKEDYILKLNPKVKDILFVIAGTFLVSIAINMVYDPLGLVTGGVTGLSIIVKSLTADLVPGGIPVWLTNVIINVPLFLAAIRVKGKRYILRTAFAFLCLTFFLYLVPVKQIIEGDFIVASIVGGVLSGIGMGLIFLAMFTTGGTDLLCALIHEKKKYYSMPRLLAIVDGAVVLVGVFVFGLEHAIYAIVAVYLSSKISDALMEGMKFAKVAFIISDNYQEIATEIMKDLNRGVTCLDITGMYSNQQKKMLYCVVSKKEIVELKEVVYKNDAKAFIIVSDAREVMGEGFIEMKK